LISGHTKPPNPHSAHEQPHPVRSARDGRASVEKCSLATAPGYSYLSSSFSEYLRYELAFEMFEAALERYINDLRKYHKISMDEEVKL
jgi:hypothetical protein